MPQALLTYPPSSSPHSRTVAARPLASAVSLLTAPSAADHLSWRTSQTDLLYTPSPPASSPTHLILSREVAHSKQLKLLLFYTTILLLVHPSFQPLHHLVIPQFHCPYIRLAGCFSTTTSFLLELQLSITLSHIKRTISFFYTALQHQNQLRQSSLSTSHYSLLPSCTLLLYIPFKNNHLTAIMAANSILSSIVTIDSQSRGIT